MLILFQAFHSNAKIACKTHKEPSKIGWEVLMHSPYSVDLVSSDYHLFLSIANNFAGEERLVKIDCLNFLPIVRNRT